MEQWRKNLYITWFTQILSLTGFGFMLPFIPFYIQELGVTSATELRFWVGLLTAAPSLLLGIMAPIWGILADRWGRKTMMLRAMAAGSLIVGLMGLVKNVETVLLLRICQGLFTGTVTASATLVASGTPRNRLSYALGFLSSSTFIGFSFGPFIGGMLAEFLGFKATFFIGSLIIFTGFIMVLLVTKEITIEEPEHDNTTTTFSLKAMLIRPFPILFILIFLVRFSRMLAVPFIPLYIQEVRQSMQGISAITGIISALAGLSTALAGLTIVRLGDKYNRLLLIAIFLGMGSIFSLPIFFTHGLVYFTIFYLAAIFFVGAIEPLMQAFLSANIHPDNRGVILGLQASAGSFGWFLSPLAASSISIYFSIKHIFLFFSISLFINFVIVSIYNRKMK